MNINDSKEYGKPARTFPLEYPGKIPDFSYLFFGDYFYKLNTHYNKRLGKSKILWSSELPSGIPKVRGGQESLNERLLKQNAASMGWRYPIVAIGSNASPAQLRAKYYKSGINPLIPVVRASLTNLDVVFSAHIAAYGSISATVNSAKETKTNIHVTFVDDPQLHLLDLTEKNYYRVKLYSKDFPLQLENGEILSEYYLYYSRNGALEVDGKSRRIADIPAQNSPFTPLRQKEILNWFLGVWNENHPNNIFDNTQKLFDQLKHDKTLASTISLWLSENYSYKDRFFDIANIDVQSYKDIPTIWAESVNDDVFTAIPTSPSKRDYGDYIVVMNDELKNKMNLDRDIVLESETEGTKFSILGKISKKDKLKSLIDIGVDQTLRDGLGIEVRDKIRIIKPRVPAKIRLARLLDVFLPRRYVIARVQRASSITIEKPVCSISPIVFETLGIDAGDKIVIEGAKETNGKYEIKQLTLKAITTPDETQKMWEEIQDGVILTRFPRCSDVLGVFPDLPWIFLDYDARQTLGLEVCAPVKVRASRLYQITKEMQNIAFLIIVTMLGALSLFDTSANTISVIIIGVTLIALLSYLSLRGKLN